MTSVTDLQKISLFSAIGVDALSDLLPSMKPVSFAPGQTIIREGEPGDSFYVILAGRVRFVTYNQSREEVILGEAEDGGYFGEISMLTGQPRAARVTAAEATQALALSSKAFESFLLSHPQAAVDVLRTLALRLYKSDELLRGMTAKNVNEIDDARMTVAERISDALANMMGSWHFIIGMSLILLLWIGWNSIASYHNVDNPMEAWPTWDEYPFVFLNFALSFLAAYSAPIIMMSQNRAADKDRLAAEIDHKVNVKSELQISQIIKRLDDLEQSVHHKTI